MRIHGWWPKLVLGVLALVSAHALASTSPPHEYYVLSPEPLTGALTLMSLEPNNTITFGGTQVTLKQYETATVPASAFTSGSKFSGTGFFTVGSNQDAADLLVPDDFAATAFVVPHIAGSHRYFFLSPSGTAQVTIQVGADTFQINAAEGVVNEFDAGNFNGVAGRITSDVPIVVSHVAYASGAAIDAYPVPPAVNEVFGIRSQNTVIGALGDGTSVTVYASNSTSASYTLNAGEQVTVTVGSSGAQGQGSALRVVANAPIAAVQYDDGDGNDATAFWTSNNFGRRHGLPIDAQYVAIACVEPSVTLTLYRGANAPETQTCSGSSTTPGKASFGSTASGANLSAGWYVISSSPVYLMYEAASPEDEHNLLGLSPLTGPAAPVLDNVISPSDDNPQPVSGTAGANQTVRLYVNGLLQATTTANASGAYTFNAILADGANTLYTTAVVSGNESDPSNAVTFDYINFLPRNQSGTISGTVVWTPGNPAQPYTVTAANLTIAAGAQLILQPGTQIRFATGRRLVVSGTLTVNGTSASNVVFTSNLATPTRGSWPGLLVNAGANVSLNNVLVEWATDGIQVNGGTFAMTNSTVRNFSSAGVVFNNASTSSVTNSTIENNDSGYCFYMSGAATPTIEGNVIANCQYGFYLTGAGNAGPQPIATDNQILSHTNTSVYAANNYPANSNVTLNFTGNWWGTTDMTTLATLMGDVTDSPQSAARPAVNYGNFLNGANGTAVPGNYVSAMVATNTTLAANTAYEVLGGLIITSGVTLTIEPGATLRFYASNAVVRVSGTLQAGGAGAPVILTTGKPAPIRGSWTGIQTVAGANISFDNVRIEWAADSLEVSSGVTLTMNNSTIRSFSNSGMAFNGASTASVSNSTVENNDSGYCFYMSGAAAPTITGTTVANCQYGFYLTAASNAGPQPVVSGGNQLLSHSNTSVYASNNYPANSNVVLNFTNNWWGTTDYAAIAASISDVNDSPASTQRAAVNFGNPLNASGGTPLPGNFVGGVITGNTTLAGNTTHEVMGSLVVPSGATLNLQPGATLRFHASNAVVRVSGGLQLGGLGTQVTLTSGKPAPTRGSWLGIQTVAGATLSLNNVLIEWATDSVEVVSGVTFTMNNSTIRNFSNSGLAFNGASTSSVSNSSIDNNDSGYCVYLSGAAAPTIQGTSVTNCQYGFYLTAASSAGPQPIVSAGNEIFSHASSSVYASNNYPANGYVNLNFTNNWWGTTDLSAIAAAIADVSDSTSSTQRAAVNFANPLDSPNGSPLPGNYVGGVLTAPSTTFSANTAYEVMGALIVPTGKTLVIESGATLRFYASNAVVRIAGTLQAGGAGGLVTLTFGKPSPTRGSWVGIQTVAGANVSLDNVRIEWAADAIEVVTGATFTMNDSTIRSFSNSGIAFNGASTANVSNSTVENNDSGYCFYMSGAAAPTITGTTVANCQYGFYLTASNNAGPQPVVSAGNQILSHGSYSVYASNNYPANSYLTLNFTNNWWGTTDLTAIAATISDQTESPTSTQRPVVNFGNPLNAPNGTPLPGTYVGGVLTATSTTFAANTVHEVMGVLIVPAGKTLIVQPGATLRFNASNGILRAEGTLQMGGTGAQTTLTSGKQPPGRGDWPGLRIMSGSNVTLDNVLIEWATDSLDVASGATLTVNNSTIRNFSNAGVIFNGPSTSTIGNSTIENNDSGYCFYMSAATAPTIQNSVIANCQYGFYLTAAAAGPQPIVSAGNQILSHSNSSVYVSNNYPANSYLTLNFTSNWWGTTDVAAIASSINDFSDSPTSTQRPAVNFGSRLDGPGGSPVPGNYLVGALPATSTTLNAGETYDVLGVVLVGAAKTLVVPAGTTLRFYSANARLLVDGTLTVQGTEASRATFTSGLTNPARADWYGIEIRASATDVSIDYAIVDWTLRAISVTGTNATISNSLIRNFSDSGIWMSGAGSASQILDNFIDNFDSTGHGISLYGSSPAITGNQIHRTSIGIFASGASNPVITGNAITNNGRGIVLDGNGSNLASAVPNPVITGNDIFGNATAQLEIYRYGSTNPVVINATDNWWGTATPVVGQHIRFTSGSPNTAANHSNPATQPRTRPVGGNLAVSQLYFSPNADSVKDVTAITSTLNQSANWTVNIRTSSYSVVRSYSGSGSSINVSWDGQNGGGQVQPDGVYTVEVTASGASGSGVVGSRQVTLDNTPPTTLISNPASGATLTNVVSVPVNGSANDPYLVSFTLQYGVGSAPTTWTNLNSQNTNGITNGLLGTWTVSSTNGSVGLGNGPHVLRLSTSDRAGNVGLVQLPVTLNLLSITAVSQNRQLMKPLLGEQLQVTFTLGAPAAVTMRIYPEAGGPLVKEMTQTFSSAGAKTMTWDGRTSAGTYVADEAYTFAISASDGVRTALYELPLTTAIGSNIGTVDPTFNASKNDFWKMSDFTIAQYGRVRMQVSGCTTPTHYPYNWVPFEPGVSHTLIWDGRGADGQLVSGTCNIYFDAPLQMRANAVIVRGTKPAIVGTGGGPDIEVKSNPYRIAHSYEQISNITYRLDQDAYVTVKLLPPGISDPANPAAIVLTDNELQAARSGTTPVDHSIQWKGYDDLDTNDILVSDEGPYTFAIQATATATGATTLYRGILQLWQ